MDPFLITTIILGAIVLGLLVAVIALAVRQTRRGKQTTKAGNVKVEDGVRYTTNAAETTADRSVAITHRQGDVTLERGVTYTVRKGGRVIPGKYTVLSGSEGTETFNLRIGGFVREFKHASDIVLAENEEICAVSHPVILR